MGYKSHISDEDCSPSWQGFVAVILFAFVGYGVYKATNSPLAGMVGFLLSPILLALAEWGDNLPAEHVSTTDVVHDGSEFGRIPIELTDDSPTVVRFREAAAKQDANFKPNEYYEAKRVLQEIAAFGIDHHTEADVANALRIVKSYDSPFIGPATPEDVAGLRLADDGMGDGAQDYVPQLYDSTRLPMPEDFEESDPRDDDSRWDYP